MYSGPFLYPTRVRYGVRVLPFIAGIWIDLPYSQIFTFYPHPSMFEYWIKAYCDRCCLPFCLAVLTDYRRDCGTGKMPKIYSAPLISLKISDAISKNALAQNKSRKLSDENTFEDFHTAVTYDPIGNGLQITIQNIIIMTIFRWCIKRGDKQGVVRGPKWGPKWVRGHLGSKPMPKG